jgi:hypothetical protein
VRTSAGHRGAHSIIREGTDAGQFQPVNPVLVHSRSGRSSCFASAQLRRRLARGGIPVAASVSRDEVVAHVQRVALIALEGRTSMNIGRRQGFLALLAASLSAGACSGRGDAAARASGCTERPMSGSHPGVGGRLIEVAVSEGDRINTGALVARLDTADADLSLRTRGSRPRPDRRGAASSRQAPGLKIRQARAQESSARADIVAAQSELEAANADLQRFEASPNRTPDRANSGTMPRRGDGSCPRHRGAGPRERRI